MIDVRTKRAGREALRTYSDMFAGVRSPSKLLALADEADDVGDIGVSFAALVELRRRRARREPLYK